MKIFSRIWSWFGTKEKPKDISTIFPPETQLALNKEFVPENFVQGIEILNDDTTTMEFVVNILTRHLGMERGDAVTTMLMIHAKGGVLLPVASIEQAESISHVVSEEARRHNFPFVCRVVNAQQGAPGDVPQAARP